MKRESEMTTRVAPSVTAESGRRVLCGKKDQVTLKGVIWRVFFESRAEKRRATEERKGEEEKTTASTNDEAAVNNFVIGCFLLASDPASAKRTITKAKRDAKGHLVAPDDGRQEMVTLKGRLDYTADYFYHELVCARRWDPRQGRGVFYEIVNVVSTSRLWNKMVYSVCESVALKENRVPPDVFEIEFSRRFGQRSIDFLRSGGVKNVLALPKTAAGFQGSEMAAWFDPSQFERFELESPLRRLVPGDFYLLDDNNNDANAGIELRKRAIKKVLRVAGSAQEAWKLTTKWSIKKHFPGLKMAPVPLDNADLNLPNNHKVALRLFFDLLHRFRKERCSSSFRQSDIAFRVIAKSVLSSKDHQMQDREEEEEAIEDALDVLVEEMELLVQEELNEETIFTFSKDYADQEAILAFYDDLRKNFRSRPQPALKEGYERNPLLTEEQYDVVKRLYSDVAFLSLVGLPGKGKSFVIEEIAKAFRNAAIVTKVGSLAAELHKVIGDRALCCSTIHMALAKMNACRERYSEVEVLVVDEFEDVDDALARKLFSKRLFPNLTRVLHAFDPMQIAPISVGSLATYFTTCSAAPDKYKKVLKEQFRFTSGGGVVGGGGGIESNVVNNDLLLIAEKYDEIVYETIDLSPSPSVKPADEEEEEEGNDDDGDGPVFHRNRLEESGKDLLFLFHRSSNEKKKRAHKNRRTLENDLQAALERGLDIVSLHRNVSAEGGEEEEVHRGGAKLQCIVSTNEYKDIYNGFVERRLKPHPDAHFYVGQTLVLEEGNYYPKLLVKDPPNNNSSIKPNVSRTGKAKKKKNKGDAADAKKEKEVPKSSGCKNGSVFRVSGFRDYDAVEKEWVASPPAITASEGGYLSTRDVSRYDVARLRRCIVTDKGDIICVHPHHVPFDKLIPGWAITVDKAKGKQAENVLLIYDYEKSRSFFGLHHVHVALTRARERTFVLGSPQSLFSLCSSKGDQSRGKEKKFNAMKYKLHCWFKEEVAPLDEKEAEDYPPLPSIEDVLGYFPATKVREEEDEQEHGDYSTTEGTTEEEEIETLSASQKRSLETKKRRREGSHDERKEKKRSRRRKTSALFISDSTLASDVTV